MFTMDQDKLLRASPNRTNTDAYYCDTEDGDTSKCFVTEMTDVFPNLYDINLLDYKKEKSHKRLPVVAIVRSTTERVEEDLNTALQATRDMTSPVIIIYFHPKGCSDSLETQDVVKEKKEYKHFRQIIDMDFSNKSFLSTISYVPEKAHQWFKHVKRWSLKKVNRSALDRLRNVIIDLNAGIEQTENNQNVVFVYDKSKTDVSDNFRRKLLDFVEGKLQMETVQETDDRKPLALICNAKDVYSADDAYWEGFKGCNRHNTFMLCLYENDENVDDKEKNKNVLDAKIHPVKLSKHAQEFVLSIKDGEVFQEFVFYYYLQKQIGNNDDYNFGSTDESSNARKTKK